MRVWEDRWRGVPEASPSTWIPRVLRTQECAPTVVSAPSSCHICSELTIGAQDELRVYNLRPVFLAIEVLKHNLEQGYSGQ